ncbi:hypothetical protein [Cellulomonas soli]
MSLKTAPPRGATSPAQPPDGPRRPRNPHRRSWQGWAYASPTAALVLVFFVVPIVLVFVMAGSDWTLLGATRAATCPRTSRRCSTTACSGRRSRSR